MELTGQQLIPASVERTWQALNDPETLKACINGCESIEQSAENEYLVAMTAKVGPVSARFKGRLRLSELVAPTSYTINFEGQGGVAGFGKGLASVALSPEGEATRLEYKASAQVGGKLAQIGSRLVAASAQKIADEFFAAFNARFAEQKTGGAEIAPSAPSASAIVVRKPGLARRLIDKLIGTWSRVVLGRSDRTEHINKGNENKQTFL